MKFYIETEKAKKYGYRYEVRTGSGMTTVNVQKPARGTDEDSWYYDVDCFTVNEDVDNQSALLHILEWEQGQEDE